MLYRLPTRNDDFVFYQNNRKFAPLMKKYMLLSCALGVSVSCNAQFFSIVGETNIERPKTATVSKASNPGIETPKPTGKESSPPAVGAPTSDADFERQMVDLWSSVSMPLDDMRVTSRYGMRHHPIYKKTMAHNGLDLGAPTGTKVYAMMDGVVARTGYDKRSGNFVVIDHGEYTVSYCHLSKILVKKGERVKAGQTTSLSGNTGASTGPHLHFGLRKNGKWCNPYVLLDKVKETRQSVLAMIQRHGWLDS